MVTARIIWYRITYPVIALVLRPIAYFFLNYRYERVKPKHKPYLYFSNHTTYWDYILVGVASRRQMFYVAGEHLFRNKLLYRVVLCLCGLIIRKKGAPAGDMILEMKQRLTEGGNVWMSPEGTRSLNGESAFISPNTGKLVKECAEIGAGLITYRIHGGYLRRPRWSTVIRKGRMWGEFVHEYSPEELKAMSLEEINRHINEDMYVNTFADQKEKHYVYKGHDLASGLETVLYVCPKCHAIGTLHSHDDKLTCECGYSVKFNEHGLFEQDGTDAMIYDNVRDWDHSQRDYLKEQLPVFMQYPADKPVCMDTEQVLGKIGALKSVENLGTGTFGIYTDRLEFNGEKGVFSFPFADIIGFAFSMQMKLLFTMKDGTYYEVESKHLRSAVKYMVLYRYLIGKEYY